MQLFQSKKAPHDREEQMHDASKYLEKINPLIEKYQSGAVSHYASITGSVILEVVYYCLGFGMFALLFVMNKMFPFYILGEIIEKRVYQEALTSKGDIDSFHLAVKGLVLLGSFLFFGLGYMRSKVRTNKNSLRQTVLMLNEVGAYFKNKKEMLEKLETSTGPEMDIKNVDNNSTNKE